MSFSECNLNAHFISTNSNTNIATTERRLKSEEPRTQDA